MKRNGIPMIAQIAFLVLLIIAYGVFGKFDIRPIVKAISISSLIMAFAVFYRTNETYYQEVYRLGKSFVTERRKMIQEDIAKLDIMKSSVCKTCNVDTNLTQDILSEWMDQCESFKKEIDVIDNNNQSYLKKQKKYRSISNILTFIAYFVSLLILYFQPESTNAEQAEGVLTLIGALLAVCTQYMNDLNVEKTISQKKLENTAAEAHDAYRAKLDKYYVALSKTTKALKVKVRAKQCVKLKKKNTKPHMVIIL